MDLILIASVLWKQKWVALPVVMLTCLAAFYVVKIKPPVYNATSSVLLTNPLKQPSQSQIAANPTLKKANSDNIFADYGDLDIVANAVIDYLRTPATQPALAKAGAGPGYQLQLGAGVGNPPIIDITGVGSTPSAAIKSARVLTAAIRQELVNLQINQGVNPFYLIGADNIVKPTQAQRSLSDRDRSLVAVLCAGILLLFIAVSSAQSAARRRRKREPDLPPQDEYVYQEDEYVYQQPAFRGPFEAFR